MNQSIHKIRLEILRKDGRRASGWDNFAILEARRQNRIDKAISIFWWVIGLFVLALGAMILNFIFN